MNEGDREVYWVSWVYLVLSSNKYFAVFMIEYVYEIYSQSVQSILKQKMTKGIIHLFGFRRRFLLNKSIIISKLIEIEWTGIGRNHMHNRRFTVWPVAEVSKKTRTNKNKQCALRATETVIVTNHPMKFAFINNFSNFFASVFLRPT